jgi:Fur family ferric uptake transcriptional regulator
MKEQVEKGVPELLRERGLRVTPQRRAVWCAFEAGSAGHLSADDVFRAASRELPELSRATVYNALNEFVAAGLLTAIEGAGVQLFDANVRPHHHFRCRSCRRLFDVHPSGIERLGLTEDGFAVERTKVLFEGLCGTCAAGAPAGATRKDR